MLLQEAEKRYDAALDCLVQDLPTLRNRLESAARQILRLQRNDLPQENLWTEHEGIKYDLTKVKKGRLGGDVSKTVAQMTDSEVQKTALMITEMASRIKRTRQAHVQQFQQVR